MYFATIFLLILKAGVYGIIICGLITLRVLLGNDGVPLVLLNMEFFLMCFILSYGLILITAIAFMKFMYICIWKSMRQMNDDLLAKIVILNAIFLSFWLNIGFLISIPR